jgi:Mg-chelatase subunit ChlD
MVTKQSEQRGAELMGGYGKHIIFILDESGSMQYDWAGVVVAYNQFLSRRRQMQSESDLVSVVQFAGSSRVTVQHISISLAPNALHFLSGGTCFYPAAVSGCQLARATPPSHVPVIVFMSDGGSAGDASRAAAEFSTLNSEIESDLELHVIAFGSGADMGQLQQIAGASPNGKVYSSADTTELSNTFVEIASGQDVAGLLEAEIGKRISEAVTDKLSLEYLA